jgi:hypothetical protein
MLSLLLALTAAAPQANAFELLHNEDGHELRWDQMPISYTVNVQNAEGISAADFKGAVRAATYAWSSVDSADVEFVSNGETETAESSHDWENVIFFDYNWQHDDDLLALNSNWSYSDGTIVGFDIRINPNHEWTVTGEEGASDLQNMLTHEIGHSLGLDHTTVDAEASMFHASAAGEMSKRTLKSDDMAGVTYLYGNGSGGNGGAINDLIDEIPNYTELVPGMCSSLPTNNTTLFPLVLVAGMMMMRRRDD